MNVLVVSESASRRQWVMGALGGSWSLSEAADGRRALQVVKDGDDDIDLVITDETAEPFGAFGLSRELKQMIDPPKIIVMLERIQDQWLAKWSGADRWLINPIDPFALADAAAELTAGTAGSRRR
ncbi:MAG: response regulator transcription factor [Actinomycetota bacterium]